MDEASLQPLAAALGMPLRIELLGIEENFDTEIDRLASLATHPAVWIGHSLGGIAAMHLAARRPELCVALVVLASNLRPGTARGSQSRVRQLAVLDENGMDVLVRRELSPIYGLSNDDELIDSLQAQAARVGVARYRNQLRYAAERPGLLSASSALHIPVLVLSGSEDPLCPPPCGEEIVARVNGARSEHHVLPGAGHLLPQQAPDWCAQHIAAFLTQPA